MSNKYPFHYEVRLKLLAFDTDNNFDIQSHVVKCDDENPLTARNRAFEIFDDYLSFPIQNGRIKKNIRGNYEIVKPSFVSKIFKQLEENFKDNFSEIEREWEQFNEEISVFLIINDIDFLKNLSNDNFYKFADGTYKTDFDIHRVSTSMFEDQYMLNNLEMIELFLFNYFKIDVSELKTTVFHYGIDYNDFEEDEEKGAKREILRTPHIWSSYNEYLEEYGDSQFEDKEDEENTITGINYLDVIRKGESHQIEFKPTLSYNFNTERGGISVLYIIAKTICSFLNSSGGVLFVGVKDSGEVQGLDYDYSLYNSENKKDKILLEVDSLIARFFGISYKPLIQATVEVIDDKDVLVIIVEKNSKPVMLLNNKDNILKKEMFIRLNASTHQLIDIEEMIGYVFNNWR